MHKIIVPALAALSLATLPTPASAQTTSVTVPIADLDLSTEAGRATLESRIEAAKARICGTVEVRQVREGADRQRCLEETEASVRAEIARVTAKDATLAVNR
jgi:UrcA family protein